MFLRNCLGVARESALGFSIFASRFSCRAASRKQSAFTVCEKFEHERGSPLKTPRPLSQELDALGNPEIV